MGSDERTPVVNCRHLRSITANQTNRDDEQSTNNKSNKRDGQLSWRRGATVAWHYKLQDTKPNKHTPQCEYNKGKHGGTTQPKTLSRQTNKRTCTRVRSTGELCGPRSRHCRLNLTLKPLTRLPHATTRLENATNENKINKE